MSLQSYIDKLRAKPERERRRIAVIATGVAFSVVFLIWVVSFSVMNEKTDGDAESASVSDQMEKIKNGAKNDGQSIEEMTQDLPVQSGSDINDIFGESLPNEGSENQNKDASSDPNRRPEIPPLP